MLIKRLPSGDFILVGYANPPTVATAGTLFFFLTRLTSAGLLETYDATDDTWKTSGLTFSGPNPAYGVPATHRKENVGTPPGVNTGLWTAVVPGGQFADGERYTARFSGWPFSAFYRVEEFELTT